VGKLGTPPLFPLRGIREASPIKETRMEAAQQTAEGKVKAAEFEPEIVAFCCEH
jgi:hypothetical protein